jgi:hypothetical protein
LLFVAAGDAPRGADVEVLDIARGIGPEDLRISVEELWGPLSNMADRPLLERNIMVVAWSAPRYPRLQSRFRPNAARDFTMNPTTLTRVARHLLVTCRVRFAFPSLVCKPPCIG